MKKILKILIPILGVVLILFAVVIFSGNMITVTRCIVTENDSLYMVYDGSPVHLSYKKDIQYETGDKLLILHRAAFAESYPEHTIAKFIVKLSSGSVEDIPQKAIDVLIETGNYTTDKK